MSLLDKSCTQLQRDEGVVLTAYPDPLSPLAQALRGAGIKLTEYQRFKGWESLSGSPWTIGVGNTGPEVKPGLVWPMAMALQELRKDAQHAIDLCEDKIPFFHRLDEARQGVLVNMMFNMGWDNPKTPAREGLSGFVNTLKLIEAGDYFGAARSLGKSKYATQVGARARRLQEQLRSGVWV